MLSTRQDPLHTEARNVNVMPEDEVGRYLSSHISTSIMPTMYHISEELEILLVRAHF